MLRRVLPALMSIVALVLATLVSLGSPSAATPSTDSDPVQRITGPDPISVAAEAVRSHYPSGQAVTFVISAGAYSDGMAAAARAAGVRAPVVLVHPTSIPSASRGALQHLNSDRIVIVGGPTVVSAEVADQLSGYARRSVERVSGPDRYTTAANLSKKYEAGVNRVYIAGGYGHADALTGGGLAGFDQVPLLLTQKDRITRSAAGELQRLRPREIVVLGGPGVVSDGVARQLRDYATSGTVRRLAGQDRYETAATIARQYPEASGMYVTNGSVYSDGLVAAALAGRTGSPLVLTRADIVPSATTSAISHHDPGTVYAMGTTRDVTEPVVDALRDQLSPPPGTTPVPLIGGYLGAPYENPDQRYRDSFGEWPQLASTYYQAQGRAGGTINRAYEQARIDRGTIPVLTVTATDGPWTMKQIGSGAADSWIDYWATELAALDGEVWFTFEHEFEVKLNQGRFSPAPTLGDYGAAFNRFQERVKAQAPNVKFMYWYGYSDKAKIDPIGAQLDRPDVIALDPYVFSHHHPETTFAEMAWPKLDWLRGRSWYQDQPIIFGEFAKDTVHGDSNAADFLTDLRPEMSRLGISGALYFSRDKPGDVMADLTTHRWPQAREAFTDSVSP